MGMLGQGTLPGGQYMQCLFFRLQGGDATPRLTCIQAGGTSGMTTACLMPRVTCFQAQQGTAGVRRAGKAGAPMPPQMGRSTVVIAGEQR